MSPSGYYILTYSYIVVHQLLLHGQAPMAIAGYMRLLSLIWEVVLWAAALVKSTIFPLWLRQRVLCLVHIHQLSLISLLYRTIFLCWFSGPNRFGSKFGVFLWTWPIYSIQALWYQAVSKPLIHNPMSMLSIITWVLSHINGNYFFLVYTSYIIHWLLLLSLNSLLC